MTSLDRFEIFAFIFSIVSLAISSTANLLWAWGSQEFRSDAFPINNYISFHSLSLTIVSTGQWISAIMFLFSSYLMHETSRDKIPRFFFIVSIGCIILAILVCPISLFTALSNTDYNQALQNDIISDIETINEPKIYLMLHTNLNCCGIFSEKTCSKNFSLKNDNETLVSCPEGSELCVKGCVDAVMENSITPVTNVAIGMEIISFGVAVFDLLILAVVTLNRWKTLKRRRTRRQTIRSVSFHQDVVCLQTGEQTRMLSSSNSL